MPYLPVTGVYYIHDADGKIIYIGKSKNIKHRINQHLTDKSTKSKKIQLQVASQLLMKKLEVNSLHYLKKVKKLNGISPFIIEL